MKNPYRVFHRTCSQLAKQISIVLVHPEQPGNIGSIARALSNMGIDGHFCVIGQSDIITEESYKFAKHAKDRLTEIQFFETLKDSLSFLRDENIKYYHLPLLLESVQPIALTLLELEKQSKEG